MKAYLTHNNAYDSVVICDDEGVVIQAAQIDDEIFKDFHSDDPDFDAWSFSVPYALDYDTDSDVDDFGDVYVSRTDDDPVIIVDDDLYARRKDYFNF